MAIYCLHRVKWFQVLLFHINSSIYQVFLSNWIHQLKEYMKVMNMIKWFYNQVSINLYIAGPTHQIKTNLPINSNLKML